MSEFGSFLKEAFVDAEPFDPDPGREALRSSVEKFTRRMRMVRWMAWGLAVPFMTAVMIWSLVSLLGASAETDTSTLFLYGMLFVWSSTGVGFVKGWFAMMQNHIVVMKELKRVQLMLVERQRD